MCSAKYADVNKCKLLFLTELQKLRGRQGVSEELY